MALSKRQKAIKAAVEPGKAYPIDEALKILRSAPWPRTRPRR